MMKKIILYTFIVISCFIPLLKANNPEEKKPIISIIDNITLPLRYNSLWYRYLLEVNEFIEPRLYEKKILQDIGDGKSKNIILLLKLPKNINESTLKESYAKIRTLSNKIKSYNNNNEIIIYGYRDSKLSNYKIVLYYRKT